MPHCRAQSWGGLSGRFGSLLAWVPVPATRCETWSPSLHLSVCFLTWIKSNSVCESTQKTVMPGTKERGW